ncbi:MAG: flagellar assembly protein FliW [Lachnospiraceae bacterium]|nr:flagellar assembly protein FliW [Lachnospiraceae bacterium]
MLVKTKYFGEIDLSDDKIFKLENGLMGFEEYTKYTLLFDSEKEQPSNIMWLQSVEEQALALPVINPLIIKKDYDPQVNEELIKQLGDLNEENLCILLTMTIASDLKKTTANLKAPIIINTDNNIGAQVICENTDYEVRYNVYDAMQKMKEGASC